MKFLIEKKDIKEVISIAKSYYGVSFTEEKAQKLIQNNNDLAVELSHGGLDTCGRETLSSIIVEDVLSDVPCNVKDKWGGGWHWPAFGSTEEYSAAFDKAFKENAESKG